MKKYISLVWVICFTSSLTLVSCKSKASLLEGNANKALSADKIIENHYNNKNDFSTLYIKANAKYKDDKQSQNVTAEIKIKKNEIILVSIRFIGITMAKALITPTEVKYYDKINQKYFEGDYALLSQWLGTDLDFQKVQNILLGKAMDDLQKSKFMVSIVDKLYKLDNNRSSATLKSFYFEADNFLLKQQEMNQPNEERALQIAYPEYKKYDNMILPLSFNIDAFHKDKKTTINIDYKNVTFNEELSFPYSVPEGYERLFIEKL
ncbi:MAG: DUF4292 domain-containing protein [Bacteroidota bacterium]